MRVCSWKDISGQRNTNLRDCLVPIFNNCFLFLKTKNTKNLFGEGGVFLFFCVFCVLKNHFFYNNKNIFSIFFYCSNNRLFFLFYLPSFCVFLTVFCIFTKMSSTQPPHSHPQTISSSLNYDNSHTYTWWQSYSLFIKIITGIKISKWNNFLNLNEFYIWKLFIYL